jgi:hypothetical protein
MTGAQIERERAKNKKTKKYSLSDSEYDEFNDMLQILTISRMQIQEAMGFALDFADMSSEVVLVCVTVSVMIMKCRLLTF